MNARVKAVIGYAVGWTVIIFFVVLLTLIFSFVGTLICAALAGMMMGAARLPRWQSLTMSLVFPAVISTVLRVSRAELAGRQIVFLSVLCFVVFWAIYSAVYLLVGQEQSQRAADARRTTGGQCTRVARPGGLRTSEEAGATRCSSRGDAALTLEDLEGKWLQQGSWRGNGAANRELEIADRTLVLRVLDARGQVRFKAKADVQLEPGPVLAIGNKHQNSIEEGSQFCI